MVTPSGTRPAMSSAAHAISCAALRLGELGDLGRQPQHDDPVHTGLRQAWTCWNAWPARSRLLLGVEERIEHGMDARKTLAGSYRRSPPA